MNTIAGLRQRRGKCLALGQEAVARMHRLGAGALAGIDDLVDRPDSSRLRAAGRSHRLVRHLDVQRVAVGLGIDRDRLDPHRRAVLMIRQAISPRLAIRMRLNMSG